MKVLVRKMNSLGLLKFELISGAFIMAVTIIGLPIGIGSIDITLLMNPYILGVVLVAMLLFGLVGFFFFIRPYILYHRLPEVLVEADEEFLYINAQKKAKIPLSEIEEATVYVDLPYLYQKEFLSEFIVHIFSEKYGTVTLDLYSHGSFKLRFVSEAQDTGDRLISFIQEMMDRDNTIEKT